ncbi:protein takeout [Drosophila yakuba]|uniref:protein takeout n=1 Tax=Drosophila yakuba TaxID=7245 RepID=UPI0019308176|nr:protein takeout [Drosophila yakuba]
MIYYRCFEGSVLLLVCLALQYTVIFANLPSTIRPCARNEPLLERCIINAVYQIRPLLVHGNLGDGFTTPPLEPLSLDNIELGLSSQFQAVFTDLEANGGSNFIIDRLIAKPLDTSYDLWITLPRIDFRGKYSLHLNWLLLDIKGKGNMQGYCENARAFVKIRGSRYLRNGKEYVKFTKMTMRIDFEDFKLNFANLFSGDRILGDVGNKLINNNQELYLKEIVPGLEQGLSKKFLDVANEIIASATFDEMFPPGKTFSNPITQPPRLPSSVLGPDIFEPPFEVGNPDGSILNKVSF